MLTLFTDRTHISYAISKDPTLERVTGLFKGKLNTIKGYYRNRDSRVNNEHLLNRIIKTLYTTTSLEIYDYIRTVETRSDFVHKNFDIVSNINKGKVLDNIFFGNESKEILLYVKEDFDTYDLETTWENLTPLKIISHDYTDVSLNLPSTTNHTIGNLTIMTIDLVQLMVQYKYWVKNRIQNEQDGNSSVFIYQYVIPNLLDSFLDISIYNRFIGLMRNPQDSFDIVVNKHPFLVPDLSSKIDRILSSVLKKIKDRDMPYEQVLKYIPTVNKLDAYETLFIPDIAPTSQSYWVIYAARLPVIESLLQFGHLKANQHHLNDLKIIIKKVKRDKLLTTQLIGYGEFIVSNALENIEEIIGGR